MSELRIAKNTSPFALKLGAPPIPHEHGAWFILYVPFVVGIVAAWPVNVAPVLLLFFAVTGAYLARHAFSLVLRQRARRLNDGTALWGVVFCALMALGGLPLLLSYRRFELFYLMGAAAIVFALHSLLMLWPQRRRMDRTQWGEVLGSCALTLTAPAAYLASTSKLDGRAWLLWLLCSLFFSSGIIYVQMRLAAVKSKKELHPSDRFRLGRDNLIYHALLAVALVVLMMRGHFPWLVALAVAPIFLRAIYGTFVLRSTPPNFKKIGLIEVAYSLWFLLFLGVALA